MKAQKVVVNDKMQKNYIYYRTEAVASNFHPDFKPDFSPAEMLALGVFEGVYLRDCQTEFPAHWFKLAKFAVNKREARLNYFGVKASQSLVIWRSKGWIHPDDPRGWFQWYCRYYLGRRHKDDVRQVKRWKAMKRHIAQILKNCRFNDLTCRPRQRQALLHWAYNSGVNNFKKIC